VQYPSRIRQKADLLFLFKIEDMGDAPTLRAAGRAWLGELLRREGLVRGLASAARSFAELGLDYLPARKRLRYGDIDYDFEHGVNTTWAAPTLPVRLREVFTRGKYQPSEPGLFHEILRGLQIDYARFTFIDLGSGKGRTLLMASDFPFRRILGAEIIPELHAIAQENIQRYRDANQQCLVLDTWLGDARDFQFPLESMVVYLFNPFPAEILQEVLKNLHTSLTNMPRESYVIYHNLIHEGVARSMSFLRPIHKTEQYAVYLAE
jgi:SAM-dependent methyltransferase